MKLVLSLDGGGVKGIITATILKEIETQVGKPIGECFDLICGVSTGGIIGAMLTTPEPYSAQDIIDFYVEHSPKIFKPRYHFPLYHLFASKYRHKPLRESLQKNLGGLRFSEATTKLMVPCYDIVERRPYFFKSWRPSVVNVATFEAISATTSAPTYFNPTRVNMGNGAAQKVLIDGSVAVNNPAMCAYAEAKHLWEDEEIFVVSIGTGDISDPVKYHEHKEWGFLNWYPDVIEILVDAPTNTVDYQLRTILPNDYVRVQQKIREASEKLDDSSRANLKRLQREGQSFVDGNRFKIEAIVSQIEKRLK